MPTSRLEAFSDGVIAIAITLLVLELQVPEPGGPSSLGHELAEKWPSYAAYVVSFLTIGIIWINHHAMIARLARANHTLLVLNLLLLMTIAIIPFSTELVADYLRESEGESLAAAIYGGSLLAMSVSFYMTQGYVLYGERGELARPEIDASERNDIRHRNRIGLLPYAIATAAAFISPYLTLGICAAVAAFYASPATTATRD